MRRVRYGLPIQKDAAVPFKNRLKQLIETVHELFTRSCRPAVTGR